MTTAQEGFKEAGDRLAALALKLKMHYEAERDGESGKGLREAVDRFGDAVSDVFDAIENAAKDDAVKADAREAAVAFRDALATTFNEIGDDVRQRFEKKPSS